MLKYTLVEERDAWFVRTFTLSPKATISFPISICLSARTRGKTRLTFIRIQFNFLFGDFTTISSENLSFF
jgi:hypothetical protein